MSKLFAYSAELYLGSLGWVDVTPDVRGPITNTRGRTSEGNRADPGRCTLRLDNLSGNYSPRNPAGAYYGQLGRNTPLRVGVPLASDTFTRTVSSGWGTADSGQAWQGSGSVAADFNVSGGLARHAQPIKNLIRVSLLDGEFRDSEQVTDFSIPAVAAGASAVTGHIARQQSTSGDFYWLRVEFDVAGALTVKISKLSGGLVELAVRSGIPGLTYTAGQVWTMRSSVSGSRLAVKIWPAGTAEPVDWTLVTSDDSIRPAGRGGLASWVVTGNTNTTEVRFDNYAAAHRRFFGEIATWPPGWNLTGTVRYVDVEAAGILRRLGQGEQPKWSAMRRTIAASGPVAYWPVEDGVAAGQAGAAVAGSAPLTVTGAVEFKAVADYVYNTTTTRYGTAALANLAAGGSMYAALPAAATAAITAAGAWMVHVTTKVDPATSSGDVVIAEWTTPGGTFVRWRFVCLAAINMQVIGYNAAGAATVVLNRGSARTSFDTFAIGARQVGGNISVALYTSSAGEPTASVAGTLAGVTSVAVNPTGATATVDMPFGHVAVWADDARPFQMGGAFDSYGAIVWDPLRSYLNEPAHVRLARLAAEDGIPLTVPAVTASAVTRMGWQQPGTFAELLDQCVLADGGYLHESRDTLGLACRPRNSLYNQTPTPIAYVGQLAPPFAPEDDADDVRNDVTVKRTEGSSARAVETSGRLAAVPPPAGVGVYRTEVELNLANDAGLADQASWRVHLGTVDRPRYPSLSAQLASPEWQADPTGVAKLLAVDTGDVLEVTGLPTWAAGDVRTLVLGYTETISEYLWSITFAGVPASPWDVAQEGGAPRVAVDGATLTAAVPSPTWMSMSLGPAADGGRWTTNASAFPLDLRVGEEQVRVSAINSSTPQIATVAPGGRGINGIARAWPVGTPVDAWAPAVVAL